MKVLIVDDHRLFLKGMEMIFCSQGHKVSIAESGQVAIELLQRQNDFDIALIDLKMPNKCGLEVIKAINSEEMNVPIAIISATENPVEINAAMESGAVGFIPKSYSPDKVFRAIDHIMNGKCYIPDEYKQPIQVYKKQLQTLASQYKIGSRQIEVLHCMHQGLSNKNIGEQLFISEATVKSHISSLFQAFQAKNRVECLASASKLGLISTS